MQKLILVQSYYTEKLDEYLNDGWYIKDFKPVSDPPSYSESYYGRITGNIYAYVLLEKVDLRRPGKRVPLNENTGYANVKPVKVKGEMLDDCD